MKEAACWAHARRAFYDLYKANASPVAAEALERIGKLYEIEDEIRGRPPDERKAIRKAREGPLLEDVRTGSRRPWRRCRRSRRLAIAIRYVLMRWTALTRYRDDGHIEIDNNAAERSLRAVALGARTTSSAGRTPAASVPRRSTAWSERRN